MTLQSNDTIRNIMKDVLTSKVSLNSDVFRLTLRYWMFYDDYSVYHNTHYSITAMSRSHGMSLRPARTRTAPHPGPGHQSADSVTRSISIKQSEYIISFHSNLLVPDKLHRKAQ